LNISRWLSTARRTTQTSLAWSQPNFITAGFWATKPSPLAIDPMIAGSSIFVTTAADSLSCSARTSGETPGAIERFISRSCPKPAPTYAANETRWTRRRAAAITAPVYLENRQSVTSITHS
jgi:hypothetical protein